MRALKELKDVAARIEPPANKADKPLRIVLSDTGIAEAIERVSLKVPEGVDYRAHIEEVVEAIGGIKLEAAAPEVSVNLDIEPLTQAVEANTKAVNELIKTLRRKKEVIYDGDKVVGLK